MKIFVNPSGQRENLGDSLLRRAYLDALRTSGELHVLSGDDASYVSGLGLRPGDVLYEAKHKWLLAAIRSGIRQRTIFAANAGEIVTGWNFLATWLWQTLISTAVRIGGGRIVMMGTSNREQPGVTRALLYDFCKRVDFLTWRDEASAQLFSKGSAQPDWAVALGQDDASLIADSEARSAVVISLRGDRPAPSEEWITSVEKTLVLLGSPTVIVVVQVQRDADRAKEIAERLGGSVVSWPSQRTHQQHEQILRDVYGRAMCVISDRIHALIVGLTEGAVPIGFSPADPTKIVKTFAAISPSVHAWSSTDQLSSSDDHAARICLAVSDGRAVISELLDARDRLRATTAGLSRTLGGTA